MPFYKRVKAVYIGICGDFKIFFQFQASFRTYTIDDDVF
jgi:hypothetical protein